MFLPWRRGACPSIFTHNGCPFNSLSNKVVVSESVEVNTSKRAVVANHPETLRREVAFPAISEAHLVSPKEQVPLCATVNNNAGSVVNSSAIGREEHLPSTPPTSPKSGLPARVAGRLTGGSIADCEEAPFDTTLDITLSSKRVVLANTFVIFSHSCYSYMTLSLMTLSLSLSLSLLLVTLL